MKHRLQRNCLCRRRRALLRSAPGLTLIELLAAFAVVMILAVIVLPLISTMSAKSDQTRCLLNLRTLGVTALIMVQENGGVLPDAMFWRAPNATRMDSVLPYLGFIDGQANTLEQTPLSCPSSFAAVGGNPDWNRSYSINIYACASENGKREDAAPFYRHFRTLDEIEHASKMAFFMDGNFLSTGSAERKVGLASVAAVWNGKTNTGFYNQHSGNTFNVVFLDGHVETRTLAEIPMGESKATRMQPFWGSRE